MKFNLHNKSFQAIANTENGEVSNHTIFHYRQEGEIVWAEYQGGHIIKGFIIGRVFNDHIEFTYQHLNNNQELMTGKCKSYPELLDNGKLKLKEIWQWTCKDFSKGESELIEI